ncbi:Glutathione S-transferase GST-6.0 [Halioglobus japonicus]|nr:Glutathione S-transferase GST-6.0 [Halioglobus japonicus]
MTIGRLKLYHYPATRSARVKWLLHELLDDDFDVEVVPLYEGAQYSAEYLQKNPNHNVPALEITLDNGEKKIMLESGAMVSLLADLYPEKGLAPAADTFSEARADYLQMLHYGTSWMDMMLWQIRIHTHMLGDDSDTKTIARYNSKFTQEVEPQLIARLDRTDYICGDTFSAVDCVMGQNVLWATAYGLCQPPQFADYIGRLSQRPAFSKAYSDMGEFSLAPPASSQRALAEQFTG